MMIASIAAPLSCVSSTALQRRTAHSQRPSQGESEPDVPGSCNRRASGQYPSRPTMSALVSITKIRLENLPVDRHEEAPDRFRVRFRSGTVSVETSSKLADADGSIEWTEPLNIRVYDTSAKLVAVIQQYNLVGGWVVRPDRLFEGSSVTTLPNTWLHTPDLPTAPRFRAELSVHSEDKDSQPMASCHEPQEDYIEMPALDSPCLLYFLGRGRVLDGGDGFKIYSPISVTGSSVTTSSSTVTGSSAGLGGFFGEGAAVGTSSEGSPHSPVGLTSRPRPVSPVASPPTASPTAPALNDDVPLQQGVLSAAAGAGGLAIPFPRPELATSRSFSCSPETSPAAQSGSDPSEVQLKQRRSPGSKGRKASALTTPFRRGLPSPKARSWWPSVFRSTNLDDLSDGDRCSDTTTVPGSPEDTMNGQHTMVPVQPQPEHSAVPGAGPTRHEKTEASLRRAFRTKGGDGSDGVHVADKDLEIAAILDDLGRGLQEAGQSDEAEGFLKRALQIKEARLEPEGVHVSWTLHELGRRVREAGRSGEPQVSPRKVLHVEEAKLGTDDISVAITLHGLGPCVRGVEPSEVAEDASNSALHVKQDELHRDDESVITVVPELPGCVRDVSQSEKTEETSERSLEVEMAKTGSDSTSAAPTLYELGRCLRAMRLPEKAGEVYKQALQETITHRGPEAPEVAMTQHELGLCWRAVGETAKAEDCLRQALPVKKSIFGARHPQVAVTLHELGKGAREAGRLQEAEGYLREALAIQENELGTHYRDLAGTLHELALSLSQLGRPAEAEDFFKQSLHIKNNKLGPDDLLDVATLHELGRGLRAAGQLGEAEEHFKRALELSEASLGPLDLQVAWTLHELGRCIGEAGRPGEAEELLKQAMELQEAKLGSDRTSANWALYELGLSTVRAGRLLVDIEIEAIVMQVDELLNHLQRRMTARA